MPAVDALLVFLLRRSAALTVALSELTCDKLRPQKKQKQKQKQKGKEQKTESAAIAAENEAAPPLEVLLELLLMGGLGFNDYSPQTSHGSDGPGEGSGSDDSRSRLMSVVQRRRNERASFWDAAVIEVIKRTAAR